MKDLEFEMKERSELPFDEDMQLAVSEFNKQSAKNKVSDLEIIAKYHPKIVSWVVKYKFDMGCGLTEKYEFKVYEENNFLCADY